ncbi:hypothetical protein PM082_018518 [Marasmius tenuissimus]|nr:hypothetical protein PM082_018518 [Marasmius tenuissimus]
MGDVFLREETWSQEVDFVIRRPSTNPFRKHVEARVKVVKKYHTATIFPHIDQTFAVITLEPKDKRDQDTTRLLWKMVYKGYSTHREPQFTHLLGLMMSDIPTFILHQELVNGYELVCQHNGTE